MNTYFKRLRKQLPHNYLVRISSEVPGITVRQIRAVFAGEIKNTETIEKVVYGALKVQRVTQMSTKRLLEKMQASKRLRKTTKRAA